MKICKGSLACLGFLFILVDLSNVGWAQCKFKQFEPDTLPPVLKPRLWEEDAFKRLSKEAQDLIKAIDTSRIFISVQKDVCIGSLKREPNLNSDQLKWLVAIEDLYEEADRLYLGARTLVIFGDLQKEKDSAFSREAVMRAVGELSKASEKEEKATRDLETLQTRLEIQKQK